MGHERFSLFGDLAQFPIVGGPSVGREESYFLSQGFQSSDPRTGDWKTPPLVRIVTQSSGQPNM